MYTILYIYVHSIVHPSSFGTPSGKDCTAYCTGLYTIPPFGTPSGKECTEYCTELYRILTIVHNMYNPVHSIVHPSSFGTPSGKEMYRIVQTMYNSFHKPIQYFTKNLGGSQRSQIHRWIYISYIYIYIYRPFHTHRFNQTTSTTTTTPIIRSITTS